MSRTDSNSIELGDTLDMGTVTSVHDKLKTVLQTESEIHLGLDKVEYFDTAGVQLLCALARTAKKRDVSLFFHGAPSALAEAVHALDLVATMGGWPASDSKEQPQEGA